MDSVAVEPGVPANADPAADSSANANNNAIALQERQQHTDNNEEGSSDSFPWWKDLAHKALEYSEDDLRPWSTVDQFRKYCAHGHHRKEIDEYTYTGSCCVELIYNILQYSSNERGVGSKINDLAKCLSRRFEKVSLTEQHGVSDFTESFKLSDCVLFKSEPRDIILGDVQTNIINELAVVSDTEMTILVQIVELLQKLIHFQSKKALATNRVRVVYMQATEKWMVALAYLVAHVLYKCCGIRSWKMIVQLTFKFTRCFKKVRFLKINAGLALFGLEILSSEATWSAPDEAIEGLTPMIVSDLLVSTSEAVLTEVCRATSLPMHILRACCCDELLTEYKNSQKQFSEGSTTALIQACRDLLKTQSPLVYIDELEKNKQSRKDKRQTTRVQHLPSAFLEASFPLDVHITILLMDGDINMALEVVGKMEKSEFLDDESKDRAWNQVFVYLLQNNLLYLDESDGLGGSGNSAYHLKKDLLLFSLVEKLQLIGWEAMIEFHNFILEKVWSNPSCTVGEKRYALLAAKKTILRCFMKKNLADGVHKFWNLSWSVDISTLYDGSNDSLLPLPPPPPAVPVGRTGKSSLSEGAVAAWAFNFLRTDNPVPSSLFDDDTGDINLMRLVTEGLLPPPKDLEPGTNEAIEQGEVEEVGEDEKETDESGVVAMDTAADDDEIVLGGVQETVTDVHGVDAQDEEVLQIDSSSEDGGGMDGDGDEDDYEDDAFEDQNEEETPIEVEDEDQDEMEDNVNDEDVYEVEDDQEDYQDDADDDRVGMSDSAQNIGTQNEPVDLLDSSPEKATSPTAQNQSDEEADSLSDGQDDGEEQVSVQNQEELDEEERADGDGSSVNGSISSGGGVQAEEKAETEVAPGGRGVFGETTEEEDDGEGQGRANRAAQAHREADVRAASLDYSSQLEEGYEPEDTHGYTEEEVSEAIHTEDEEEERRQSLAKSSTSHEVDPSSQQQSRQEVEPASARNIPHSSDDMDAADEHTEQEEDLAESSELEETADGLPPPAPASTQEFMDAPRDEGNLRNLVDFAHSAMRRHDTLSNVTRIPAASPAETGRPEDNFNSASGQSEAVAALLSVAGRQPEMSKGGSGEALIASTEPMDVDSADVQVSNEATGGNDFGVQPSADDQAMELNQDDNVEVVDIEENEAGPDEPTPGDSVHGDDEAEDSREPTDRTEQEEMPKEACDNAVQDENQADVEAGNKLTGGEDIPEESALENDDGDLEKPQNDSMDVQAEVIEGDAQATVDQVQEEITVPVLDGGDADETEAATPVVKDSSDNEVAVEGADYEQVAHEAKTGEDEPENRQEVDDAEGKQSDDAKGDMIGTQGDEENDGALIKRDAVVEQDDNKVDGDSELGADVESAVLGNETLDAKEGQDYVNATVRGGIVEEANAANDTDEDNAEDNAPSNQDAVPRNAEDSAPSNQDAVPRVTRRRGRAKTETVTEDQPDEDVASPVKKTRGRRTRKNQPTQASGGEAEESEKPESEPEPSPVKKIRGRPRKNPPPQESDGEAKDSQPEPVPSPPKKKRGRQRKNLPPEESNEADDEPEPEPEPSPPKRRRGRPPKNPPPEELDEEADDPEPEPEQEASPPKRRRGRPPKKPQPAESVDADDSVASRRPKRGAKKSTPNADDDASAASNVSSARRSTRGKKKLDQDDESVASNVSSTRRPTRGAKRKAADNIPASEDDTTSQKSKRGRKKKTQDDAGSVASAASKTRTTRGRKKKNDENNDNDSTVSSPRKSTRRSARAAAAQTRGGDDDDQSVASTGSRSTRRSARTTARKVNAQQGDDDDVSVASRTRRSKRNQNDASEGESVVSATGSKGRPKRKRNQDSGSETTASKRRTTRSRGLSKIEEE